MDPLAGLSGTSTATTTQNLTGQPFHVTGTLCRPRTDPLHADRGRIESALREGTLFGFVDAPLMAHRYAEYRVEQRILREPLRIELDQAIRGHVV